MLYVVVVDLEVLKLVVNEVVKVVVVDFDVLYVVVVERLVENVVVVDFDVLNVVVVERLVENVVVVAFDVLNVVEVDRDVLKVVSNVVVKDVENDLMPLINPIVTQNHRYSLQGCWSYRQRNTPKLIFRLRP